MKREPKLNENRQKKIVIVSELSEKFGKAKAVVFTSYQGLTHKQIEGFKKAIKPLNAEYVVAKNSLLTIALSENKITLEEINKLDGQTGTLFLYEDVISPLKALAKTIKELNLPGVKFGIMEKNFITGEQVLKLSTLPTKEVLLTQLVGTLKSPIFGLHRALNWNLQKFVMTLNAIVSVKPALATATATSAATMTQTMPTVNEPEATPDTDEREPETILAETVEEKVAELPDAPTTTETTTEEEPKTENTEETLSPNEDNKGGEN